MNNQELEQNILANVPILNGISKSDLFRLLRTDKSRMINAVNHLIDLGNIKQETRGNRHVLTRIDGASDIETFNSVMKWQSDLLVESTKKLIKLKKLFKVRKYKKKPTEYKPIDSNVTQELMQFTMFIDYFMQHANKYNYMKSLKTIPEKDANFRINKIEKMVRKSIDQVFAKHKSEKYGLIMWIKNTDRTWHVLI